MWSITKDEIITDIIETRAMKKWGSGWSIVKIFSFIYL